MKFRLVTLLATLACLAGLAAPSAQAAPHSAYATALDYTVRFYPRYLTYFQQRYSGVPKYVNRITGPATMGPKYGIVVAPNNDTVYAEAFLDLEKGPQILTIPSSKDVYSLLALDQFGNVIETGIREPGTYALVPAGYTGPLPLDATRVTVPYRVTTWIFRADRYSADGTNMVHEAQRFRLGLHLASLPDWEADHGAGKAILVPLKLFGPRTKEVADRAVAQQPTNFLRRLQIAMHAPTTAPLSASDRSLSRRFDLVFLRANRAAEHGRYYPLSRVIAGAQEAHALIVDHWRSHVGPTRWVHFENVGEWGTAYLDRAALSEFVQLGNNASAALYYQAFVTSKGVPLNGSTAPVAIKFSPGQIPEAKRFWSLTAYVPGGETLYANPLDKYLVASYTPGLVKDADGSVSLWISHAKPRGVPQANWLPVPAGPYSLLLRIYGPTGRSAPGSGYVPPEVRAFGIPGSEGLLSGGL
jgi:hypothetical protein